MLVLGLMVGCDGGQGESSGDAGVDGPGAVDGGGGTSVGPSGGTVSLFGGKVKLEVPAGALEAETSIRARVAASYPKDSRLVSARSTTCCRMGLCSTSR